ncbi:MAG: hypothetical protein ABJN42_26470, partial [Roseibium sp.]|uniref:hypothetical protein n=1 Tax=Roseibium sp. TaxID=1936156 RepID=UPI00329A11C0
RSTPRTFWWCSKADRGSLPGVLPAAPDPSTYGRGASMPGKQLSMGTPLALPHDEGIGWFRLSRAAFSSSF